MLRKEEEREAMVGQELQRSEEMQVRQAYSSGASLWVLQAENSILRSKAAHVMVSPHRTCCLDPETDSELQAQGSCSLNTAAAV